MTISKTKLLEIKIKKKLNLDFIWSYKTFFSWSWMIFSYLRDYVVWDNIKNIDWKTSAKQNKFYVKEYESDRELNVLFVLDLTQSMYFAIPENKEKTKKDLLLEVFFLLSFSCIESVEKIWIILFDEEKYDFIDFKSGFENIALFEKKIDDFCQNKFAKPDRYMEILEKIYKNTKNKLVFILTDKFDFKQDIFKLLSYQNNIVFVHIFDYFENNLSSEKKNFNLWFMNSFLNINLSDEKIEKFRNLRKDKIIEFKKQLNKLKIRYIYLDTKSDIFKEFMRFFKTN